MTTWPIRMAAVFILGMSIGSETYAQTPISDVPLPQQQGGTPISHDYPANQAAFPTGYIPRPKPPQERNTSAGTVVSSLRIQSKYMISAERLSKANGCDAPEAAMTAKNPDSEIFRVTCSSGQIMIVRCDYNVCRLPTELSP